VSDDPAVAGLGELLAALEQFPVKLETNILRGALRAGAKPMAQVARDTAPAETGGKHPGALRQSVRISSRVTAGVVRATVKVGDKIAFYARFVAGGTRPHLERPAGKKSLFFAGISRDVVHHPGAKPNDWMLRTLKDTAQRSLEAVAAYATKRFTKEGINVPGPEG
jgi:HK97 gp10 family phage protein